MRAGSSQEIEAFALLTELQDALEASGYCGHDLALLLLRITFCLFADSDPAFKRGTSLRLLAEHTNEDGSDTDPVLLQVFAAPQKEPDDHPKELESDFGPLPPLALQLFTKPIRTPRFSAGMRALLLNASQLDWTQVSPLIFGAILQSVTQPPQRRRDGTHYTSERDIHKVLDPLFLDALKEEFASILQRPDAQRRADLIAFHAQLSTLRFLDPACGTGNFLIVAYRELCEIERRLVRELYPEGRERVWNDSCLAQVGLHQFFGIEIEPLSAQVAALSLWVTGHILNQGHLGTFGTKSVREMSGEVGCIVSADALDLDWNTVLPAGECSFVLGNPPFLGAKYQNQKQRNQVRRIANLGGAGGTLDYVSAWFLRAGEYVQEGSARIAFVATNSITQGEQVAQLWPILFARYHLEIEFAHRTFAWRSDVRGMAQVHVVVLGLRKEVLPGSAKRLFDYVRRSPEPVETKHATLSPYLVGASHLKNKHLVVKETSTSISNAPKLVIGSKPIDGGHYIFDAEQRRVFLNAEPNAGPYLYPYVGAAEFLKGNERWILVPANIPSSEVHTMRLVCERVASVSAYRAASRSKPTHELAQEPTRYHVTVVPREPFLVIPKVSSERRDYLPIGWLTPPTVPSDLLFVLKEASLWHFAVLTSRMHMAWLRAVGGRLKSDYRYSIGMVYNTFPWPERGEKMELAIEALARNILEQRTAFPGRCLGNLYDTSAMPTSLRRAHEELDRAVDELYRRSRFDDDRQRVEHLMGRYEELVRAEARPHRARRQRAFSICFTSSSQDSGAK